MKLISIKKIATNVAGYAHLSRLETEVGFDGVEHVAANGYLIEQFLNANVNNRQGSFGGSAETAIALHWNT